MKELDTLRALYFNLRASYFLLPVAAHNVARGRPIHFHINRTIVIGPVKQNQLKQPSPHCLVYQIQVQKPIQVVSTDKMPDYT